MWYDVKYSSAVVVCGPHYITHFISHQHLLQHTIPLCNTTFQIAPYWSHYIAPYWSHYGSHGHVSHCTPFHITFHLPCTPRHISDHTISGHYASHHRHLAHHISQAAPHHVLHNCIIPHLTVITSNSTSHHRSVYHTFYIPPLITSCTTPPPLPHIAPCHSPHTTSFHITQHSTFHATHTHTTLFHIAQHSIFHATAHTPPRSTSHNIPHSMPQHTLLHSTSHNVPHSMPQHTHQSILHHCFPP